MKVICLILVPIALMAGACGVSSVNHDPREHLAVVDHSRIKGVVVISLDTIFSSGVPYAVIRSSPVVLAGRERGTGAHVHDLTGARVVRILPVSLYGEHYVSYRFDDGRFIDTAYLPYHETLLHDAEMIVRGGLLSRDGINQVQAREFVEQYPKPHYREPERGDMVPRDRSRRITVRRGEIWQTGVKIGSYDSTGITVSGIPCAQINIRYIDSSPCATVTYSVKPADSSAGVVTTRDRRSHLVNMEPKVSLLETTLSFLVREGYL